MHGFLFSFPYKYLISHSLRSLSTQTPVSGAKILEARKEWQIKMMAALFFLPQQRVLISRAAPNYRLLKPLLSQPVTRRRSNVAKKSVPTIEPKVVKAVVKKRVSVSGVVKAVIAVLAVSKQKYPQVWVVSHFTKYS